MKIPASLKIGGHTVKVDRVSMTCKGDRLAEVLVSQNIITIADRYISEGKQKVIPESMKAEAFLHELVHYVLMQCGYGANEKLTCALSAGLFQILRDNDIDFRRPVKK